MKIRRVSYGTHKLCSCRSRDNWQSTDYDEIIQIGITFVSNNKISGTYHSMIRTDLDIPPFIQALTSIEDTMLEQAPYFHEIAQEIYKQLKDRVFVAHNVDFDLNFIKRPFKTVI